MGLMGLTLLTTALFYLVFKIFLPFEEAQTGAFITGFVVGGSMLASAAFNYFSTTANGSSYLTLPASSFEKWLCAILIVGVLFPGIFLLLFRVLDLTIIHLYHSGLDPKDPFYREKYQAVNLFPFDGFVASKVYIMFLNSTALMLIGSLYFNKNNFIKCALIACILFIGGHFLNGGIAGLFFTSIDKALPYYAVFITVGKEFGKIMLPAYASKTVDFLLYIFPLTLWGVTWLRLKEKEF